MDAKLELKKIRDAKKLQSQKSEFARRKSKLDVYRTPIFTLHYEGATLSEIQKYILNNLVKEDRENGFKVHRTTIQKYIQRFTNTNG